MWKTDFLGLMLTPQVQILVPESIYIFIGFYLFTLHL